MTAPAEVWQCGGGTQSVAIAVLICQGKLPKPDHAIIADTGYERASTWAYMDSTLAPRLRGVGVNLIRARASEYAYAHDGLFNKKGTLLVPAYTTQNEETEGTGKMSNFCTTYWKKDVCDNYLRREHGIGKNQNVKWIGFSIDEMRRATRMMASVAFQEGRIRFPLVDLRLCRADSIKLVLDAGWPLPPRSNCFLCPNQHDDEWIDLKANSPAEFDLVVQYERHVRERDPHAYFHPSGVPLDEVVFGAAEGLPVRGCDSGICFI